MTVLWGYTFVTIKEAIEHIPPLEFLAVRFLIGAAFLGAVSPKSVPEIRGAAAKGGLIAGAMLAAGYAFQTLGLKLTSATNAGFLTGLFVVFTPILGALVVRRLPNAVVSGAVLVAALGLILLILDSDPAFRGGDVLQVGAALAFAVHILLLGHYAPIAGARPLTISQLATCGGVCAALTLVFETPILPVTGTVWFAILLTAIGASSLAFLVMTWAQSLLSPTRAAIIMAAEPVFAGIFGYLLLAERLTPRGWVGALLILGAILLVEVTGRGDYPPKGLKNEPADSSS